MTDLPSFDPPPQTEPPSPKKPRRKPQRQAVKAAAVVRKRRVPKKRAKPSVVRINMDARDIGGRKTEPSVQSAIKPFRPEIYDLIGVLMRLDVGTRGAVIEIVRALST